MRSLLEMMKINPMIQWSNEDDCEVSPGAGPCPACLKHSELKNFFFFFFSSAANQGVRELVATML